jgi:hypothetical protein
MSKSKKIIIYVEGQTDKAGLEALLSERISSALNNGVTIDIFHPSKSDHQKTLIYNYPIKAIKTIQNNPKSIVFILPDLHPMNRHGMTYNTHDELCKIIQSHAEKVSTDSRILTRFHAHCFVHEFEALLMACPKEIETLTGTTVPSEYNWSNPEQQNGKFPPKKVIEHIYPTYEGAADAAKILKEVPLEQITAKCPYFAQFVAVLNSAIDKELP